MNGTGPNTFSPDRSVTRAEFLKIIIGTLDNGFKADSNVGFKDVDPGQWYADYINWAEKGIVEGDGSGYFKPGDMITREQMAVMIQNFIKAIDESFLTDSYKEFDSQISSWAKDAVKFVQTSGVINGKPDGNFDPKGLATRAEASKVTRILIEKMSK